MNEKPATDETNSSCFGLTEMVVLFNDIKQKSQFERIQTGLVNDNDYLKLLFRLVK